MHIQFNISGKAEERLKIRAGEASPGMVVKGDVIEYWMLLESATPRFTRAEASLLLDVLNSEYLGQETAHLLWASVADACHDDALATKWGVDTDALVARIRGFDRLTAIAMARAVAFAWDCMGAGQSIDEALVSAGLVEES